MNVYRCWHSGIKGYACRVREQTWMFVPELGQPDNRVYKSLELMDLTFLNKFEMEYEMRLEASMNSNRVVRFLKKLFSRGKETVTVYGKILLS